MTELVPSGDLMKQLPPELIVRIFEFTDLVTRIQRASLSKSIQKVVHNGKELWTVLSFDEDERCRKNLTDEALKGLLTRVNAREVTKSISLRGCIKIQGTGLKPLYDSKVLETVLVDSCHKCNKTSCEKYPQLFEFERCDDCNHLFCREECHGYGYDRDCGSCQKVFCDECNPVDFCFGCSARLCSRCAEEDNNWEAPLACSQCDRWCCDDCVDDLEYSIKICDLCQVLFCTTCREVKYVDCCSLDVCTGCKNTVYCQVCEKYNCEECVTIQQCTSCRKAACESCCYRCASCGKAACKSCYHFGNCVECNEKPPKRVKRNNDGI